MVSDEDAADDELCNSRSINSQSKEEGKIPIRVKETPITLCSTFHLLLLFCIILFHPLVLAEEIKMHVWSPTVLPKMIVTKLLRADEQGLFLVTLY